MNTSTASDLDLRTNVSDVNSGLNPKSANKSVRGPLETATSSGKAMIVAGGLGLCGTEEDGGGDNAVVVRGHSENLGAEGGDEDGSAGGSALPDLEMDVRSWEVGPACRLGFPTGRCEDKVGSVRGAVGDEGGHISMSFSFKIC